MNLFTMADAFEVAEFRRRRPMSAQARQAISRALRGKKRLRRLGSVRKDRQALGAVAVTSAVGGAALLARMAARRKQGGQPMAPPKATPNPNQYRNPIGPMQKATPNPNQYRNPIGPIQKATPNPNQYRNPIGPDRETPIPAGTGFGPLVRAGSGKKKSKSGGKKRKR